MGRQGLIMRYRYCVFALTLVLCLMTAVFVHVVKLKVGDPDAFRRPVTPAIADRAEALRFYFT